jgi:hypothetical protein
MITIFKNIFSKEPHYIPAADALNRIAVGRSKVLVEQIRECLDKEKANKLKCNLPSVCFSGKFGAERKDDSLIEHSGLIVLDFDNVEDLRNRQSEIISEKFVYACWVSPSGSGLKALVKIASGKKHRQHFDALREIFPDCDKSGVNPSRVCYESYDADIYINPEPEVFKKIKKVEKIEVKERTESYDKIFQNLLKWLTNKNDAFVTGERNNFIFKLACACCRFGIPEDAAQSSISIEFLNNSEFTTQECNRAIRSAYKANANKYGDASFEKERLVDKITRREVEIDSAVYDPEIRPKDVIYGVDVKEKALLIYDKGYPTINGIGVPLIDDRFKPKKGEITLLTGIGNYGKSSWKRWYQVMRAILYDEKFGTFSPEDNPPEEYYHDLTEIFIGCDCTPSNQYRPSRENYESAYDFVTSHFFYIYPKDSEPTPSYIKERFLELIIKEQIDGCDIDPFNQLHNNYAGFAGRDKYLEWVLTEFSRFAVINQVYFWIVAHPIKLPKNPDGNYVCPDVFDVADGAMWNNKMDNILVYHRPYFQTDPGNPTVEFHSKKIRRQKTVGKRGFAIFEMLFKTRRYFFEGGDPMQKILNQNQIVFDAVAVELPFEKEEGKPGWLPYKDTDSGEPLSF